MRKFRASETLLEKVLNVMVRRGILYKVLREEGTVLIETELSGETFHKVVIRAKMEKMQEERGGPIPYVASCEMHDRIVKDEVGDCFCIVFGDE